MFNKCKGCCNPMGYVHIARGVAILLIISAFSMVVWDFVLIKNMSILSEFSTNVVFFFIWSRMVFIIGSLVIAGVLMHFSQKMSARNSIVHQSDKALETEESYSHLIKQEQTMIVIFKIISGITLFAAITMMIYTVVFGSGIAYLDKYWSGDVSWSFVILSAWSRGVFIVVNVLFGFLALHQMNVHQNTLVNYLSKISK